MMRGQLLIALAALLWSLSGALTKILTTDQGWAAYLGLSAPPLDGLVIAFFRALFAGLFFVPLLRRSSFSFRWPMLPMVLCFAAMNALFVSAMALGSAANAIILQYTAPMWLYLAGIAWLQEQSDRRSTIALLIAMSGVAVIVGDASLRPTPDTLWAILIGLGSGLTYAGVIFFLRVLRGAASEWLVVQNHLCAALLLLPVLVWFTRPTLPQLGFLVFFGVVQMGIPYLLMSRGLRTVGVQEAGTITLLEPLLNPVWTCLVVGEVPDAATFLGGGLILAGLVWRYGPRRTRPAKAPRRKEEDA
jgi:drug/metabolite transporter (DMT)-like permease